MLDEPTIIPIEAEAPTFTVGLVINGETVDVTGDGHPAIEVLLRLSGHTRVQLTFTRPRSDGPTAWCNWLDELAWDLGAPVTLLMGYEGSPKWMVEGELTCLKPRFPLKSDPTMTVEAEGHLLPDPAGRHAFTWGMDLVRMVGARRYAEKVRHIRVGDRDVYVPHEEDDEQQSLPGRLAELGTYELTRTHAACAGMPELRPQAMVELDGLGRRYSGDYYVTRVRHTLAAGDKARLLTDFEGFLIPSDLPRL